MKKIKIEFISKGFEQILCSDGARQSCETQGKEIKARADAALSSEDTDGFKTDGKVVTAYGSKRWMQFVYTTDAPTMLAEKYDNVLSKAVNG